MSKFYTEKQLRYVCQFVRGKNTNNLIDSLTPVELPTDQEVEEYLNSFPYTKHLDDGQYNDGVIYGAYLAIEWFKDKMLKYIK